MLLLLHLHFKIIAMAHTNIGLVLDVPVKSDTVRKTVHAS